MEAMAIGSGNPCNSIIYQPPCPGSAIGTNVENLDAAVPRLLHGHAIFVDARAFLDHLNQEEDFRPGPGSSCLRVFRRKDSWKTRNGRKAAETSEAGRNRVPS